MRDSLKGVIARRGVPKAFGMAIYIIKDEIPHVVRNDKSEGCGMTIFKALSVKIAQFRIYIYIYGREQICLIE